MIKIQKSLLMEEFEQQNERLFVQIARRFQKLWTFEIAKNNKKFEHLEVVNSQEI